MRIFGIHTKIILPMAILFVTALVVVGYISTTTIGKLVEESYEIRATNLNRVLFRMGYPINEAMMDKIKSVLNVDIAITDVTDYVIFSSIKMLDGTKLKPHEQIEVLSSKHTWGKLKSGGKKYAYVCVRVPRGTSEINPTNIRPFANIEYLFLIIPQAEIDSAKARAIKPIINFAAFGFILTLILGFLIARTISKPLRTLAAASDNIAHGGDQTALQVNSHDEVRDLANAMSKMLKSLKEAEEKIIGSERLAAIGQVSAGLAHEIRNPLSSMKMNVQLLTKQVANSEVANTAISNILNEIERLDITITELLTLTKRDKLDLDNVDVHNLLDETVSLLARQMEHAQISVERNFDKGILSVRADRVKLRQVFFNLILNAMQAMPRGGQIEIATYVENKNDMKYFCVSIADQGSGVVSENRERIFEILYTTKPGGSGLGLPIAKEIAIEHKGKLELVDSSSGAKFVLSLPLSEV